jgi:hypothetical protein
MVDFTQDVVNFEKNGVFNYKFDEAGNVVLTPSASIYQQFYVSIPLEDINYDDTKISSFYNTTFTEFVNPNLNITSSVLSDVTDQLNSSISQSQQLQSRLDSLIVQSELNNSAANIQLVRDIILGLRIQMGQGFSSVDFDTVFPYIPISIDNKNNAPPA